MADTSAPLSPPPEPVPTKPKKRKRLLLLLLLLLLFAGGGTTTWVVIRSATPKLPYSVEQGEVDILAGNIVMKVWDSEAEDGDVIQVYFNGKLLADELAILNTPVEYKLGWLSPGEYTMIVSALNEGASAPASVHVSLGDGTNEKEFSMDATLITAAAWKVTVK